MSVHPLILCSNTLYDVQISEDAKQIASLKQNVEEWKMKCTYLTILGFQDFSRNWQKDTITTLYQTVCNENIFNEFKSTAVTPTSNKNMLFYLLNACNIVYSVRETIGKNIVHFPYINCAEEEVDLVVVGGENAQLLIGKRFWNAGNREQQKKVYFFKYMLDQIYCYIGLEIEYDNRYFNVQYEGSILYVMEQFYWPYRRNDMFLETGTLSFEEYLSCSPRTFRGNSLKWYQNNTT